MNFFNNLKNRNLFLCFFIFIVVFFVTLLITYIYAPLYNDGVWLYGFGKNIVDGLVIYRDFSVITTPLYYFVETFFIRLFGNYLISVDIFNSLLFASIVLLMFKTVKFKAFFIFPLIMIFYPNGYNLFSLFWLMLILFLIDKKLDNDCLIGFIVGLSFLTKQNIGFMLFIPALFYSKKRVKTIICFMIPFLILVLYLIYNDALYSFVDCCFLGLFDFGSKNHHHYNLIVFFELFILFYLMYVLFKSKFQNKEVFYILMFQILIFPLMESYHFLVSFFPVVYYFFKNNKNKYILNIFGFAIIWFTICLFILINKEIHLEKDLLFLKNSGDLSSLMEVFHDYLAEVDNFYFTGYYGYLYKLYYEIPINHYDLWNEGNLGYNGIERRINEVDEVCNNEDCIFIIDSSIESSEAAQDYKFYFYVKDNYIKIGNYDIFDIYSNNINLKNT